MLTLLVTQLLIYWVLCEPYAFEYSVLGGFLRQKPLSREWANLLFPSKELKTPKSFRGGVQARTGSTMVAQVDTCFTNWNSKLLFFWGRVVVVFNPQNHWFKRIKVKDHYCWTMSAGLAPRSFHIPGARIAYLTQLVHINNANYLLRPTFEMVFNGTAHIPDVNTISFFSWY